MNSDSMSYTWTSTFLAAPWLAALLWLTLHGVDWVLTIRGARLRELVLTRAGAKAASDYELNPIFRKDVARLRLGSTRFAVTWIGGALVFWVALFVFALLRDRGLVDFVVAFLLGMLLFTRLVIIGRHLRNIYLFSRLLRPSAPSAFAQTQLDLELNLRLSALMFLEAAVLVGLATLLTGNTWTMGGTLGLLLLASKHCVLAARAARHRTPPSEGAQQCLGRA
jgi:hypothetical protein